MVDQLQRGVDQLQGRVELHGRSASERSRSTAGESRAVYRSLGCWVEELLCALVELTAAV